MRELFHVKQYNNQNRNKQHISTHRNMNNEYLMKHLRSIEDFPKQGINFRDVTTLFKDAKCIKIMDKELYELYKDKGLQIVSISADANEADWLKALDEEKLEWPNDIDGDKGIANLYKVQFYPTVYLLDSEARVLGANDEVRGENLRNKLAELFK